MPYREKETEKVYFKIAEVAKMVNQATSALRYWETEFEWLEPKKNKHGNRQYKREDLSDVIDINFMLNIMGMTIKGAKLAKQYDYIEELKNLYTLNVRGQIKE